MKITNIVLAALMIVAAPTFAQQVATKATDAAVTAAVKNLQSGQAQRVAQQLGLSPNATSAQVVAALLKKFDDKALQSIGSVQNGKLVISSNQLMAAVNSSSNKMPDQANKEADGGVTVGSTDRETRKGGSLIGSVNQEPVRGADSDRLDVMVRSCNADGISGACDKLKDEASKQTWAALSSKIVSNASAKGLTTASQVKADTAAWTRNVVETVQSHFKTTCADAVVRIKGLSAKVKDGCQVINEAFLNQAALACTR